MFIDHPQTSAVLPVELNSANHNYDAFTNIHNNEGSHKEHNINASVLNIAIKASTVGDILPPPKFSASESLVGDQLPPPKMMRKI